MSEAWCVALNNWMAVIQNENCLFLILVYMELLVFDYKIITAVRLSKLGVFLFSDFCYFKIDPMFKVLWLYFKTLWIYFKYMDTHSKTRLTVCMREVIPAKPTTLLPSRKWMSEHNPSFQNWPLIPLLTSIKDLFLFL